MPYVNGMCPPALSQEDTMALITQIAKDKGITESDVVSSVIRATLSFSNHISSLMQYVIDIASDEFMSNDFYRSDPELMSFLASCGTNDEDLQMVNFIESHQDMMVCRNKGCKGKLHGSCPILHCYDCGASYYLHVPELSDTVCGRCVSDIVKKCNKATRMKRPIIYAL